MCGIAGIYSASGFVDPESTRDTIQAMSARIAYRGPDAHGLVIQSNVALAHRRLSIIDPVGGAQPMQSEDGNLTVTFNGEIFNYIELREQLRAKGRQFRTGSDTEVLLHLYREYGLEFPKFLNGQFAIGLWDKSKQRLILVRDRVGICPLFFFSRADSLVFASEIKALQPAYPGNFEIAPRALDQVFTGWACVGSMTLFQDIRQLEPGKMLVVDAGNRQTETRYWNLDYPVDPQDYDDRPVGSLVEDLQDRLVSATRIRLRADVPVGAYLSGGLDSSLLVALIKQHTEAPLHSFSLAFENPALDESSFQQQVVTALGLRHESVRVREDQIAEDLERTIWHCETPILRTAPVPMGFLSKLVHDNNYKVVVTGEGADEVLGGYDIFKESKVRQFWSRFPESQRRPLLLLKLYPYLKLPQGDAAAYLKQFFGVGLDSPELLWHSQLPRWQSTAKAKLFYSDGLKESLTGTFEDEIAALFPSSASSWHSFNRAQHLEMKTLMSGYLLSSQGDRMLARNSVEGRFPYLDHNVIEFANRLPPKMKMKALNEKYLLKKLAEQYLPPAIVERFKQPYRAPDVSSNQQSALSASLRDYISADSLNKSGLFDPTRVAMLLKKIDRAGALNTAEAQAFTGILSTQILYHQYCQ